MGPTSRTGDGPTSSGPPPTSCGTSRSTPPRPTRSTPPRPATHREIGDLAQRVDPGRRGPVRAGHRDPGAVTGPQRVHVLHRGARTDERHRHDRRLPADDEDGLLPAVRERDGRHAALDRDPGTGRGRIHAGRGGRERPAVLGSRPTTPTPGWRCCSRRTDGSSSSPRRTAGRTCSGLPLPRPHRAAAVREPRRQPVRDHPGRTSQTERVAGTRRRPDRGARSRRDVAPRRSGPVDRPAATGRSDRSATWRRPRAARRATRCSPSLLVGRRASPSCRRPTHGSAGAGSRGPGPSHGA